MQKINNFKYANIAPHQGGVGGWVRSSFALPSLYLRLATIKQANGERRNSKPTP